MADDDDRDEIIKSDSLAHKEENGINPSQAGGAGLSVAQSDTPNEGVKYLGIMHLPSQDVKGVRIVLGVGALIAVISAVALGISYAVGAEQVKMTGLVTTDCAPCADMGADILRQGGSAVDATVTTTLCNGLVNMHSSGIGGDGFIMIRDHKNEVSMAIDFRAQAPIGSSPDQYTNSDQLQFGPLAVAVPGEVAGLAMAHQYYGKLAWKDLIRPVAELARKGFPLTEALSNCLDNDRAGLMSYLKENSTELYAMLIDPANGQSKSVGTLIKRADYAEALDLIAEDPAYFYHSEISRDIVDTLSGTMSLNDFTLYKARRGSVLQVPYQGYTLETAGPPAGGVLLLHMLKILEGYNFTSADKDSDLMYHRMVEAMKFGFAVYPDNVDFENNTERHNFTDSLLREGHCEEMRQRITDNQTHNVAYYDPHYAFTAPSGTSGVSAIDEDELFVSSITTLGDHFGSAVVTKKYGIILNNCMASFDYNFTGIIPGFRVNEDNMVKGGRRPRSNMSPTVFFNNEFRCGKRGAVGGSQGLKIIPGTLQYLLDVLSFGISSSEAMERKRLAHHLMPNNTLYYEDGFPAETRNLLRARGHIMVVEDPLSVLSAGYKSDKVLYGKGDAREEGKSTIIQ